MSFTPNDEYSKQKIKEIENTLKAQDKEQDQQFKTAMKAGEKALDDEIEAIQKKINYKISTSDLNDFFFETIRKAPAPVWGTTNVKFYYLTQAAS